MMKILLPYDPAEAISVKEAAARAGKSERTIRNWCLDRQIGRCIAGRSAVSVPALDMLLAGDVETLEAYLLVTERLIAWHLTSPPDQFRLPPLHRRSRRFPVLPILPMRTLGVPRWSHVPPRCGVHCCKFISLTAYVFVCRGV
jgi:hypothetical protein